MGMLLHLTDLHLAGDDSKDDVTGDYKLDVIPLPDRQRRTAAISDTLYHLGLALAEAGIKLDAVVITGDVTYMGRPDGFELIDGVLNKLGNAKPSNDRILIVPGNHDVQWGSEPGSTERYQQFLTLRAKGYQTAYLEGIDVRTDGEFVNGANVPEPCVVANDDSFVVVGINSSDFCGRQHPVEKGLVGGIDELRVLATAETPQGEAVAELIKAWTARGQYDIARVSRAQRHCCHKLAARRRADIIDAGKEAPVMIAALHHQLMPVSATEEVKPFEGITNQGEVREWLQRNEFDILLHGHKHDERVLQDMFVPFDGGPDSATHRLLIASGPTIGHGQPASSPIGRLITVDPSAPRISEVEFKLIPAGAAGLPIDLGGLPAARYIVGDGGSAHLGLIEGDSVDDVYNTILTLRGKLDSLPRPLVCRFSNGPSARQAPRNYRGERLEGADRDKLQKWFGDTVELWQKAECSPASQFNHGERIQARRSSDSSQFLLAIENLRRDLFTSRAVVILVRPSTDFDDSTKVFPAFVLAQFQVVGRALTVTAYFRKQEMPHWWPINVGELAYLQEKAIDALSEYDIELTAGNICTITAEPVAGPGAPRVLIPEADRRAETPEAFLSLLVPLYFGGQSVDEMQRRWSEVIDDWRPTEEPAADGDPVPVLGFEALATFAESLNELTAAQRADPRRGEELVGLLRQIHSANTLYSEGQRETDRSSRRRRWKRDVGPTLAKLYDTIAGMVVDATGE